MEKARKRLIYFLLVLLVLIGVYLYFANGFIYYRIGAGNLSAPINHASYIMNDKPGIENTLKYVALGDSLTTGAGTTRHDETLPYLLAEKLSGNDKKVVLVNLSYPGAKTGDLINDLLNNAVIAQPDVVTLLIGVNDIHNHVDSEIFKSNYRYILERLTKETKAKIYVINIPLIGSNTVILPPLDIYFNSQTKKFNNIISELSSSYDLKYIDLYSPSYELLRSDGSHYSADSFHPSALGYKTWAKIIYDNFDK